jgi:hypothetical protein
LNQLKFHEEWQFFWLWKLELDHKEYEGECWYEYTDLQDMDRFIGDAFIRHSLERAIENTFKRCGSGRATKNAF